MEFVIAANGGGIEAAVQERRDELGGIVQPHGGQELVEAGNGVAVELIHPLRLVRHDQAPHASRLLGGDPDGTGVGLTAHRLDAAQCHHHRSCRVRVVGALGDAGGDGAATIDLAGYADLDLVTQPAAH